MLMRHLARRFAAAAAATAATLAVAALPFTARAATTFTTTSITTDNFTANGNVSFNDASADTIILGQNGGTPDTVQVAGNVSLTDANWSVSATGVAAFASVNGLSLAANTDGFQVSGGTTPRTFVLTGGNLTLTASAATALTLPSTGTLATLAGSETLSNKAIAMPRITTGIFDNNGNEILMFPLTVGAVNEFTMTNAATGGHPIFEVTGGDANVGLTLQTKGTGDFDFQTTSVTADVLRLRPAPGAARNTGVITSADLTAGRTWTLPDAAGNVVLDSASQTLTNKTLTAPRVSGIKDANGNDILAFNATAGAVNGFQMFNAGAGVDPSLLVIGTDANIDMRVQAKGAGTVMLLNSSTGADMFAFQPAAGASTFLGTVTSADLDANRTWTLPNVSGTLALTSDITGAAGWTDGGAAVTLVTASDNVGIGAAPSGKLHVTGGVAGTPVLIVTGAASQSANLQEWKDNGGNVVARVTNIGDLRIRGNGGTSVIESDTSATVSLFNAVPTTVNFAGAATALNMGATSGTTTVLNNLAINGHTTLGGLAADPTGSNGRAYYNTATNKFRCHENSTWKDCIAAGVGVSGTPLAGQAAFFTGPSTLSSDVGFFWDNTNKRLGIGTNAPPTALTVVASGAAVGTALTSLQIDAMTTGTPTANFGASLLFRAEDTNATADVVANIDAVYSDPTHTSEDTEIRFFTRSGGGALTQAMVIGNTGGLSVAGSAVLGDAASDTVTLTAATMALPNNLNVDADTLFVDATNNRVGIGDASPLALLTVGTSDAFQVSASGNVSTAGTLAVGAGGTAIANHKSILTTLDIPAASANACSLLLIDSTSVGISATLGDTVTITPASDDPAWDVGQLSIFVEQANQLKVSYCTHGSTGDPVGGQFRIGHWRY